MKLSNLSEILTNLADNAYPAIAAEYQRGKLPNFTHTRLVDGSKIACH